MLYTKIAIRERILNIIWNLAVPNLGIKCIDNANEIIIITDEMIGVIALDLHQK